MFIALLGAVGVLSRLLPHPPNMAAVGALALFAGARGKSKWYIFTPLLVMAITDPILGFYEWGTMAAVYGSFLLMGALGWWAKRNISRLRVLMAGVAGEVLFFLITNWAVWAFSPMYAKTLGGLLESYALALPFLRNSLAGTLVYTGIFFGAYEWAKKRQKVPKLSTGLQTREVVQ